MPQIFRPRANTIARVLIFGAALAPVAALAIAMVVVRAPYVTGEDRARIQPIPFSHAHHIGGLGIDCRYCHRQVERSSFAGLPSTDACMSCHSQLWNDAPMLQPLRDRLRSGRALRWQRVHDLPDFVYFDHGIYVRQGVGCTTARSSSTALPRRAVIWIYGSARSIRQCC